MAFVEKQLAQARENSTNAVSVYSPPNARTTAIVKTIIICNSTAGAIAVRLFLDDDGSTYDQSTALLYDYSIAANSYVELNGFYPMSDSDGNLAYRSATANALTITIFGAEIT